jgi:hypothetical protein
MSARNANHILAALQSSGELQVRPNEGPKGTNRYRIVLPQGVKDSSGVTDLSGVKRASGVKDSSGLKPASSPPEKSSRNPLKPASDKPSFNRQEPSPPQPPKGLVRFAEFWLAWPKNERKGGKAKCEEAWAKRGLDSEADAIVAHVKAMADTEGWRKEAGRYVPAPLVYLNGRRWDGADLGQAGRESLFEGAI